MDIIELANVVTMSDEMAGIYLKALGRATTGDGLGTAGSSYGAWDVASSLEASAIETAKYDVIVTLGPAFRALKNAVDVNVLAAAYLAPAINALGVACANAGTQDELSGVADLDSYATYYNLTATTKWGCLFAPELRSAYFAALAKYPSVHNVYYEVLQSDSDNGMGKRVYGSGAGYSTGTAIDSTKYAGGFGQVNAVGLDVGGSVTVAGTWRKTDGTTATGNGTATVSAGSSLTVLTPPFTAALLVSVTDVTATSVTSGTLYAEAARPAGRPSPPT